MEFFEDDSVQTRSISLSLFAGGGRSERPKVRLPVLFPGFCSCTTSLFFATRWKTKYRLPRQFLPLFLPGFPSFGISVIQEVMPIVPLEAFESAPPLTAGVAANFQVKRAGIAIVLGTEG